MEFFGIGRPSTNAACSSDMFKLFGHDCMPTSRLASPTASSTRTFLVSGGASLLLQCRGRPGLLVQEPFLMHGRMVPGETTGWLGNNALIYWIYCYQWWYRFQAAEHLLLVRCQRLAKGRSPAQNTADSPNEHGPTGDVFSLLAQLVMFFPSRKKIWIAV